MKHAWWKSVENYLKYITIIIDDLTMDEKTFNFLILNSYYREYSDIFA